MAVLFVALGMWQLRRHEERRELNATVDTRLAEPPVQLDEIDWSDPDLFRHRRVEVRGSYDPAGQVLVRNQSFRGSSGYHLVLPLLLDRGGAVLVDRGFITLGAGDEGAYPAPPAGAVTVSGIVLESETRGSFGPRDPDEGVLDTVSRVDVPRIQQQVAAALAPGYVLLQDQSPVLRAGDPLVAPPPDPGRGRHFGYALQWFGFALIAVVGFALLVRRTARQRGVTPRAAPAPGR